MLVILAKVFVFLALREIVEAKIRPAGDSHSNPEKRIVGSDDTKVEFLLLTKDTIKNPKMATVDDEGLLFDGRLDVNKPTKMIIHGWLDTWKDVYTQTMIASYLPRFDYNVVVVNWPEADNPLYFPSRNKVPVVGKTVGKLLGRLSAENGVAPSTVHVVGHSLGAHVAAVAGYSLADNRIGKITALDPAYPGFSIGGADTLSQKAANFVEVVHTCGRFLGIFDEIGHVDFYPNGGEPFQPGCGFSLSCSHKRSFKFYSEAIANSSAFIGTKCSDWDTYKDGGCAKNERIYMNESTLTSARGKFYLKTAASSPYGLGINS